MSIEQYWRLNTVGVMAYDNEVAISHQPFKDNKVLC